MMDLYLNVKRLYFMLKSDLSQHLTRELMYNELTCNKYKCK